MPTAVTISRANDDGVTATSIGNSGPTDTASTPPRTAALTATTTACSARPASTIQVVTPSALNTAKSRVRSRADR